MSMPVIGPDIMQNSLLLPCHHHHYIAYPVDVAVIQQLEASAVNNVKKWRLLQSGNELFIGHLCPSWTLKDMVEALLIQHIDN